MTTLLWKRFAGVIAPAAALMYAGIEVTERSLADWRLFSGRWEIPLGDVGGDSWANLATIQDQRGENPLAALRRAVELSPAEAGYRSRLGLAEEAVGDLDGAERDLVRASELSRKFEPWWNLLNFYFPERAVGSVLADGKPGSSGILRGPVRFVRPVLES